MTPQCEAVMQGMGTGVTSALRAVDCASVEMTASAFGRLFASGGAMVTTLTILLTLYIAFFAIQLMLGRGSLGVGSLTPRFLTLGLVLTVATSWVAYQTLVANLAIGGPDYLASLLLGGNSSATQTFGANIDIVFAAVQQATGQGVSGAQAGGGGDASREILTFSPEGLLWMGATLFLLGTVGVLVTARIGLAVLIALGPLFVVMVLFTGTRGLFVGWVKGVLLLALTPLFAVLAGSLMLELAVPVLSNLASAPGQINAQAAMAFFMIGAVHVALMIMTIKIATTMVAGWTMFGLAPAREQMTAAVPLAPESSSQRAVSRNESVSARAMAAPGPMQTVAASRPGAAIMPAMAANDAGSAANVGQRSAKIFAVSPGGTSSRNLVDGPTQGTSRAVGIGSRFRAVHSGTLEKRK